MPFTQSRNIWSIDCVNFYIKYRTYANEAMKALKTGSQTLSGGDSGRQEQVMFKVLRQARVTLVSGEKTVVRQT